MVLAWLENARRKILEEHLHIFVIVFFEFFGTLFFAYGNLNLINLKGNNKTIQHKIIYFFIDFSLSMFMCISYGRQFSGGLYNPAVAIFRMCRKTQRYSVPIGLLYIVCQIAGSITGCFIALYLNNVQHAPITVILPWEVQVNRIATQILGAMILTFMVQLITEKKMTYIEHNRQYYIAIPLYYLIARTYSAKSNGLNPAFGIGYQIVWCFSNNKWNVFQMVYIIVVGPILGALLGCFLFEFGMRPMFPVKKQAIIPMEQELVQIKPQRRWTLNEALNQEKFAPLATEYKFENIEQDEYDDEIKSEQENEGEEPMQSELEKIIKKTPAVSNVRRSHVVGFRQTFLVDQQIQLLESSRRRNKTQLITNKF